jgi:3-oxoacyl-[acyl-carrier protein] reductase
MHEELERAFSLAGRKAVVTGAAGGIGRQAAITFAQAGADVAIADRQEEGLRETARLVEQLGRRAEVRVVDVTERAQVEALAEHASAMLGGLDVWANVAGVIRYSPIVDTTEEDLRAIVDVNLLGVYWGVAAAGRRMAAQGSGAIVNIASAGGDVPAPTLSVYGMTKAAVMHLTKTAAHELGPSGVRVNGVAPGWIETPMVAHYFTREDGTVDPEARRRIIETRAASSPLRTTGHVTDIAYAMLYLASDAARFVTGQIMRPNGGTYMT